MRLFEVAYEPCVFMDPLRTPDGEGSFLTQWQEGVAFDAAISFDSSMQARVAEKAGVTSLYTVTTRKNTLLMYHNVFKRLSDGKIFRVTSDGDDKVTPQVSSFQFRQVTAEEWRLT